MRRTLAAAILGIGLWIGSLAWSGFLVNNTILNPDKSRDVADVLYENDAVRDQIVKNIADAVEAGLPEGAPVPREAVERAARTALESPVVEEVLVEALVRSHQAFLGEGEAPKVIDAGAFGAAARDGLVSANPALDGILPPAPALETRLPTDRIPNLGPVRRALDVVIPVLALASAAGIAAAFLVTSNRPAIMRRAGVWALLLSSSVLLFAYGVPWLAERFAPSQSEVVAALIGALVKQTRGPATAAAIVGLGAIATSFVWKAAPVVVGALDGVFDSGGAAPVATPVPASMPRMQMPTRSMPRTAVPPTAPAPAPPRSRKPDGYGPERGVPAPDPHPGYPTASPAHPPARTTAPRPGADLGPRTRAPDPMPGAPRTRWVEGVGHVLESSESVPADARWVPGVGYVVDRP